jgi:hypothetical protein
MALHTAEMARGLIEYLDIKIKINFVFQNACQNASSRRRHIRDSAILATHSLMVAGLQKWPGAS